MVTDTVKVLRLCTGMGCLMYKNREKCPNAKAYFSFNN